MRVRFSTQRSIHGHALALAVFLLAAGTPASASPSLMTRKNAAEPAVASGRVFWAERHGRHVAVLVAAPGGGARTIFRLAGPHARSSPPYAQIVAVRASSSLVAFTVTAGYGDPFRCNAIDEHPAGDTRCKAGRETLAALYAGPVGGPYQQLSGVTGQRAPGCRPGTAPGTFDVAGGAVAFTEKTVTCAGGHRQVGSRLVVRDVLGKGAARILESCAVNRTASPYDDAIALAGEYLAWAPEACDRLQRVRLFRWRTGELVYRLPYRWYLSPFDVASDGTVIGGATLSSSGQDVHGYLVAFPPKAHPKPRVLPRFGTDVLAVRAGPHQLAVEYSESDSAQTAVLAISDRGGGHRRLLATGLVPDFPWIDFAGKLVAWTRGDPPERVYAERAPR